MDTYVESRGNYLQCKDSLDVGMSPVPTELIFNPWRSDCSNSTPGEFMLPMKPPLISRSCYVVYGPSGIGKSALMESLHDILHRYYGKDVFYKNNGKYWDGYLGERICIFSNFNGSYAKDELRMLVDRSALYLPTKSGSEDMDLS